MTKIKEYFTTKVVMTRLAFTAFVVLAAFAGSIIA